MQFQVPQFIDTEDKLIGGVLTLRQFLYISAGAGVSFLFFFIFNTITWILMTAVVAAVVMAVGFVRINGRPLPKIAFFIFTYYWNPRLYTWQNKTTPKTEDSPAIKTKTQAASSPEAYRFHKKTPAEPPSPENKAIGAIAVPTTKASETAPLIQSPIPKDHKIPATKGNNDGVISALENNLAVIEEDVSAVRKKISNSGDIQSLLEKINTTKSILPKREKIFNFFHLKKSGDDKTGGETVRKSTGELFEARRIDYK